MQLSKDQIIVLQDAFKTSSLIRREGLFFDDRNYKCIRADKSSIYAKAVSACIIYLLGVCGGHAWIYASGYVTLELFKRFTVRKKIENSQRIQCGLAPICGEQAGGKSRNFQKKI